MATATTVSIPTGTWSVDKAHSSIEFRAKHLGISTVRGAFNEFEGSLEIGDDLLAAKAYGKSVPARSTPTSPAGTSTCAARTSSMSAGAGLRTGHLHLHVGDIEEGLAFYRDVLGFDVMVNLGSAAFVSAGGYHHHLGFNVWMGSDVGAPPPRTAGLRHWTVVLDAAQEVSDVRERVSAAGYEVVDEDGGFLVRDPWGTGVAFLAD